MQVKQQKCKNIAILKPWRTDRFKKKKNGLSISVLALALGLSEGHTNQPQSR